MDLTSIPVMAAIKSRMVWLTKNQSVISQNIANANTPGYQPNTLKPQDFSRLLNHAPRAGATGLRLSGTTGGGGLSQTHAGHLTTGGSRAGAAPKIIAKREVLETSPNGNGVSLEEQMMEMTRTQLEYNAMASLYRKQVALIKTALGKSGG